MSLAAKLCYDFVDIECPQRIDGCWKNNLLMVEYHYRSHEITEIKCECSDEHYSGCCSESYFERTLNMGMTLTDMAKSNRFHDELQHIHDIAVRYWAVYDEFGGIKCTDIQRGLMCRACFERIIDDYKEGRRQFPPEEKKEVSRDDSTTENSPDGSEKRDIRW